MRAALLIPSRSDASEWIARLALVVWCGFFGVIYASRTTQLLHHAFDAPTIIRLCADACMLLFYSTIVLAAVTRQSPVAKAPGILPRLEALLGSYLLLALPYVSTRQNSVMLDLISSALILTGYVIAGYGLLHLRRSFSIMAEARSLVTYGPYRFVRHPLYVAEEVALCGVILQYASWHAALLFAFQIFFQGRRILNEEGILAAAFPEYRVYAARVARLVPGVW